MVGSLSGKIQNNQIYLLLSKRDNKIKWKIKSIKASGNELLDDTFHSFDDCRRHLDCRSELKTLCIILQSIWILTNLPIPVDNPQLAAVLVKLCSTGFGVYCLTVISENVKETLHMFNVGAKFMNFKLCLLFINIQSRLKILK